MVSKAAIRWLLGVPIRAWFGNRTLALQGEAGHPLRFYPSESPRLLLGPRHSDAHLFEQWKKLLCPGDVIVDVGAHIGITVQRFYAILEGQCCILAFEPIPRNFKLLEENTGFIPAKKLHTFNIALGDKDGTVVFTDNLRHGAISRISVMKPSDRSSYWSSVQEIEVQMSRIDTVLQQEDIPTPTFFKMDVEGAGGLLLQGASNLLATAKPTFYCEYHTANERQQTKMTLKDAGYLGVQFDKTGLPEWCDPLSAPPYYVHPDHPSSARLGRPSLR